MESRTQRNLFVSRLRGLPIRMMLMSMLIACADPPARTVRHASTGPAKCEAAILVYHQVSPVASTDTAEDREYSVTPENFTRQMRYLRTAGYNVVPFGRIVDCAKDGKGLPPKAVALTFDDGDGSQFRNAFHILSSEGLPATFFVTTRFVGSGDHLTGSQLKTLQNAGMTIGAHTLSHPHLTEISDAELDEQVLRSAMLLENFLQERVPYFAYPYGETDGRVTAAVRRAGYRAARGTGSGHVHGKKDLYDLHAFNCNDDTQAFKRALRF